MKERITYEQRSYLCCENERTRRFGIDMRVIVHFNKPQYKYINNTTKKPISCEIIVGVELIINNKDQLIIDVDNGSSIIYEQKIVSGIVVKEGNNL